MSDLIDRQAALDAIKKLEKPAPTAQHLSAIFDCEDTIKALPPAQPGWIPCSKEPDTDRSVFIARGYDDMVSVCIGYYDHDYKQWYEERNWFAKCLYDGLYWCEMPPLPIPYREGGKDGV